MRPRFSALLLCLTSLLTFAGTGLAAPNAPTSLTTFITKQASSHTYAWLWTDNSTDETSFLISYRIGTTGIFNPLYTSNSATPPNTTGNTGVVLPGITALGVGTVIQFQVTAQNASGESSPTNTTTITIPADAFTAPTLGTTTAASESVVSVSWTDNSTTEDGEELELSSDGGATYSKLTDVYFYQARSINITGLAPGTTYKARLRAYKEGTPRTYTAYSSVGTATTPFNAPTALAATAASETSVSLTWTDNSAVEGGYAVYFKPTSSGTYTLFNYAAANATSYSVTGLTPGTAYDFQVAAAYQATPTSVIESARSNTASATTKDGFTSSSYITFGPNNTYTYQATTSNASPRTSWNAATGLPTGMSFSTSTGAITGTPTQFGLFTATLSATFANGWTATLPLTLRIARQPTAPTVASALPTAQTFAPGDGAATISLAGKFADQDTESAVRLVTSKGNVDVLLYPNETPTTVTNFLGYVGRGDYDNSAFHRISDLATSGVAVLQGGQIKPSGSGPTAFTAITAQSAIQNEPGISNLNYTIAMAKLGNNPNSATKEFYFNLTDLDAVLDPPSLNGGFTVFGRVSNATKSNLDALSSAPTGGPYDTLVDGVSTNTGFKWPMNVATAGDVPSVMDNTKVMKILSASTISQTLTNSATSSVPGVATAAVVGSNLVITPVGAGQTTVTVTATDLDGMTATQSVSVTVNQAPTFTNGPPPSTAVVGTAYNFAYTASGFPVPTFSKTGTLPPGLTLSSAGVISGNPTTAGTYSNIVVTASNGIGTAQTQTISITVNQAPAITSTAPAAGVVGTPYTHTYAATGSPAPTYSLTAGALPNGLSVSSAGVISGTPSTVGTFSGTITASNSAGSSPQAFSITINQAPAFTSSEPTSTGTYNTPYSFTCTASGSPAPTFSVATGALPPGLSLSTSGVISGTPTAAGTYTGTLSASNGIGSAASQSFNITIQKATATVTLGSLEQTYTGSPLAVTSTTTPSNLNVTYTYGGSASPPTGAGSYAVIATINDANYTGTANGTLVISKATATVTLGSLSQTYDGTARVATAATTPSGKTVTFTYNGSSTAPTNAGTYQVIGTIVDANYAGTSTALDLVVAKATATVTLGSLSQTYDGTARVATATTTPSGKTVTFTYDGSSTPPTNAGTYQVIGTIVDANYAGSSTPQDLVVAKATATVTLGSLSQTYDGTARVATATTTPSGKTVTFTYNGSSTPPTNAGTYQVIGTIVDANYAGTSTAQDLVVAKAAATVTLGSLSQTYDGTARVATSTTTPSSLNVTYTYGGFATPPTNAGSYAVVGTINDTNYAGTANGTLVIAKATASLSLGSLSATYDGSAHAATASTTPSGLAVVLTYDSSPTAPTNAGTYAVAASINDTNYQGTATGSLTIAKAAASLLLGSLAQTYDGSPKSATATTTPAGLSKSFTYDSSPTAPTNAGSYAVVGTINEANYAGTATGTLVITKATATITLNGTTQTYDGSAKSVSPSTSPSGLTVNVTYDGSPTAPTSHGTYAVAASINDANYTGSTTGTLTITGQSAGSWRTQHFTATQISNGQADDNADPDGDGIKNLIEYALGTDPLARTAALSPIHDANGLTLIFTRPKDLPGVIYSVESTDNLSGWSALTLEVITDGPVQTVRARDPLTTGNPNRRFIRLALTPVTP